jgi:hypothetical protein
VDEPGNPLVKESGLELNFEKDAVKRVKRRIYVILYSGQIYAVVFDARVVAHDRKGEGGKQQD